MAINVKVLTTSKLLALSNSQTYKYPIADIDECKEGIACRCDGCTCKDTWGGFECGCHGDKLYIMEHDMCIGKNTGWNGWIYIFFH